MDISLDLYKSFYYVCKFKSITQAGNVLYLSQPAVSKQLKKLEEGIGKVLFIRQTNGVELTDDGKKLYEDIKEPLEKIFAIENSIQTKNNNYNYTIRILAGHLTVKTFILDSMAKFNKKYPNIKFQIDTYSSSHELINKLRNNEVDLIFFSSDELVEEYNDLIIKEICPLQDILVSSGSRRSNYPTKISLLDLNEYPTVAKTQNSISRRNIDRFFENNNKIFIPTFEISKYWLVTEYIKLGLGIGILTQEFIKKELEEGSLIKIDTIENIPPRKLMCAERKNCACSDILKEFLKIVKSKNA